jgi:hypothetical protein
MAVNPLSKPVSVPVRPVDMPEQTDPAATSTNETLRAETAVRSAPAVIAGRNLAEELGASVLETGSDVAMARSKVAGAESLLDKGGKIIGGAMGVYALYRLPQTVHDVKAAYNAASEQFTHPTNDPEKLHERMETIAGGLDGAVITATGAMVSLDVGEKVVNGYRATSAATAALRAAAPELGATATKAIAKAASKAALTGAEHAVEHASVAGVQTAAVAAATAAATKAAQTATEKGVAEIAGNAAAKVATKAATGIGSRLIGAAVPVLATGIAVADTAAAVAVTKDPKSSKGEVAAAWVTAGGSWLCAAATVLPPGASQVVGLAGTGLALGGVAASWLLGRNKE